VFKKEKVDAWPRAMKERPFQTLSIVLLLVVRIGGCGELLARAHISI